MHRILIISSTFPPNSSVGGLRPFYFFKHFNQSELNTFVFTINHDSYNDKMDLNIDKSLEHKIHYFNYTKNREREYLKKRTIVKKVRDFFNPSYSSPPGLLDRAKEKIQQTYNINDFDLILATVPDMWTAALGAYLSKKYNIKFIIDFRDVYEQEKGMPRAIRQKLQVQRFLFERRKIVKVAFELATVSKFLAKELEQKFNKKTTVIYNGYDESLFEAKNEQPDIKNIADKNVIKIIYVGRILNFWYRNPKPLINAFKDLDKLDEFKPKVELHFYGTEKEIALSLMKESNLENIYFHDRINYSKVKNVLYEADLLLILTNNRRKGILTTKLFEYMPMNKPVIFIPNDDQELKELINEYGLGFNFENQEQIIDFFKNYDSRMDTFKKNKLARRSIKCFTREHQSNNMKKVIDEVLN